MEFTALSLFMFFFTVVVQHEECQILIVLSGRLGANLFSVSHWGMFSHIAHTEDLLPVGKCFGEETRCCTVFSHMAFQLKIIGLFFIMHWFWV